MARFREIRADFDRDTIVVYQAFRAEIADAAIEAGRFVSPFSLGRMTWIKPSYLWLMERSNWGRKPQQERILAVRITREGWNTALSRGVLTSFEPRVHGSVDAWRQQFDDAVVHVQWDPERSIHGKKQAHRSIQVGLSRQICRNYVDHWIVGITDLTPLTHKIRRLCEEGEHDRAKRLLPAEKAFEVSDEIAARLGMVE
jgi:hypothetical protein